MVVYHVCGGWTPTTLTSRSRWSFDPKARFTL